jgi:ABC-type glycerol-3-phosphate transport system permease component
VFAAAAAVLTLEILTVRLLAPYVGLTIETYTAIIGVALAGIAAGAALGGRLADEVDPVALIGTLLAAGGVLAMLPAIAIFVTMQRFIVGALTGAIKG